MRRYNYGVFDILYRHINHLKELEFDLCSVFFFLSWDAGNELTMVRAVNTCIYSVDLKLFCVLDDCKGYCARRFGPKAIGTCVTEEVCNCSYPC